MDFENNRVITWEEFVKPWEVDEFIAHLSLHDALCSSHVCIASRWSLS
jgi:hypothetical protein